MDRSANAAGPRVLVVDDEATIRHVLREILADHGCEVHDAGSAEEGLTLADGLSFDVAMLDIVLPGMNGIELLRAIRDVSPQTQVIMMTSHASLETTLEAIEHGAYGYLQKPFEELDLIWTTVSRAFEKRRLMGLLEQRDFELRKASAANRAKSEFLAVIGHELLTPLNAILGYSELLIEQVETLTADEMNADLTRIHDAGRKLLRQINDVLDVAKVDSGKFEIAQSEFNTHSVVDRVRDSFTGPARTKGLHIAVDIETGVPADLTGDAERVGQVLAKILDNAIKFTGSGTIAIHVSCAETDGDSCALRFEIRDTGIGVPAECREQIFEPFTVGDSSFVRDYDGVGMGLALAKRLVEAMGGTIGVDDNDTSGSTFWFKVPFAVRVLACANENRR